MLTKHKSNRPPCFLFYLSHYPEGIRDVDRPYGPTHIHVWGVLSNDLLPSSFNIPGFRKAGFRSSKSFGPLLTHSHNPSQSNHQMRNSLYSDSEQDGHSNTVIDQQQVSHLLQDLSKSHSEQDGHSSTPSQQPEQPREPPKLVSETRKMQLVSVLAAMAGMADVWMFHHFGCFANMMTGNLIMSIIALTDGQLGKFFNRSLAILGYKLGVMGCRWLETSPSPSSKSTSPSDSASPWSKQERIWTHSRRISLILFLISDMVGHAFGATYSLPVLSVAFGFFNASVRNVGPTAVATGAIMRSSINVADGLREFLNKTPPQKKVERGRYLLIAFTTALLVWSWIRKAFMIYIGNEKATAVGVLQALVKIPVASCLGIIYFGIFKYYYRYEESSTNG